MTCGRVLYLYCFVTIAVGILLCLRSCSDGIQNGGEVCVDGGSACHIGCDDGNACSMAGDCTSSVCTNGVCVAPSCYDHGASCTCEGVVAVVAGSWCYVRRWLCSLLSLVCVTQSRTATRAASTVALSARAARVRLAASALSTTIARRWCVGLAGQSTTSCTTYLA